MLEGSIRCKYLWTINLTLEGPCIIFAICIHPNEIHNVVALIKFLLVLRCQLYMFRTVTVHPQELLCRYCMCRLWYVGCDVAVVHAECVQNYIVYLVGLYIYCKNDTRTIQCHV